MTNAAGAEITDALTKCVASIPIPMYAAKIPPEIVANPPTINDINSDLVIDGTYGLTTKGASV